MLLGGDYSKSRWVKTIVLHQLQSLGYYLFCSRYSRNQKVLRPFVAPSLVQVQSLSSIANQNSREFRWLLRSPFNGGPISVFNFQSFSKVDPLLTRKELLLLSLYCLIQAVSLFKNILGLLSKDGKNYKKNIIKNVGVCR